MKFNPTAVVFGVRAALHRLCRVWRWRVHSHTSAHGHPNPRPPYSHSNSNPGDSHADSNPCASYSYPNPNHRTDSDGDPWAYTDPYRQFHTHSANTHSYSDEYTGPLKFEQRRVPT